LNVLKTFFLIETLRDLDEALDTDAQLPILQVADELPPLLPSHEYYKSHKRDFPTRWNSTFSMIQSILQHKGPLSSVLCKIGKPELVPDDYIVELMSVRRVNTSQYWKRKNICHKEEKPHIKGKAMKEKLKFIPKTRNTRQIETKTKFIGKKKKRQNPYYGDKAVTSEMALQRNLATLKRKRRVAQAKEIVPVFTEDFQFAFNFPFGPVDVYYLWMLKVQPWSIEEFRGWHLCE